MEDKGLINGILYYQQCLDKYARRNDEARVLYCLSKLYKMPINIAHLEETGVGRTVNALRKLNGEIAEAAKTLVGKWKEMVAAIGEENQANSVPKSDPIKKPECEIKRKSDKDVHSSSHRDSDKKRSNFKSETDTKSHLRKVKEESRHNKFIPNSCSEDEIKVSTKKVSDNVKTPYSRSSSVSEDENDTNSKESKREYDHKKEYSKPKSKRRRDSSDELCNESDSDKHKSKLLKTRADETCIKHTLHKKADEKSKKSNGKQHSRDKEEKGDLRSPQKSSSKHRKTNSKQHNSDSDVEVVKVKHKSHATINMEDQRLSKHYKRFNHCSDNEESCKLKHQLYKNQEKSSKHKSNLKQHSDSEEENLNNKQKYDFDSDEFDEEEKVEIKKYKNKEDKKEKSKSIQSKSSFDKKDKLRSSSRKSEKKSSQKGNFEIGENGIGSGSGASFAEALGMLIPTSKANKKKVAVIHPFPVEKQSLSRDSSPDDLTSKVPELLSKKLAPLDVNVDNLLPEITPNYRPIGLPFNTASKKIISDDETLGAIMYSKISRTKVYSGNKIIWGIVPSLFDICTRVLQDNIDALEYTGGVPYLILKPVIERANPDQLFMLEHHNPYLIEDTDELWQLHCNKEFRSKRREEMETWRDMYMRCLDEREAKLKALTANIKQSQDKSMPMRQTKLAYVDSFVKPPRNIARKQAKHGTGGVDKKPSVTPSSRLTQFAMSGVAGQVAVPNPGSRAASSTPTSTAILKPKKAPLMQKTLALMKSRIFRR